MTLDYITSDSLNPVRHGFFTRRGGASSGIFAGLNCGVGSTDQREIVEINRGRVADAMEVPLTHLLGMNQIHSATVHVATDAAQTRPKADGLVTNVPGLALSVLTADCQPVLFADAKAGVIGTAHAGWRGALDGVLKATVDAMEGLGARRQDISAVIGPCISQGAYEVGKDFYKTFIAVDPGFARFFAQGAEDRMHFDLPGFGLYRLMEAGVGQAEWTHDCTYSDPDRFFSYRRTTHAREADYGRLIASIVL